MKKKYYLVYKTTNLVNGKIYIGKHETNNLDDGYLGSGILIRRAIEKYGKENFKREILFECSSREEMNAKEAKLVNEEFLKRDDIYNLKQGGEGGFDFINTEQEIKSKASSTRWENMSEDRRVEVNRRVSEALKRLWKEHPDKFHTPNMYVPDPMAFKGKHHTEETRRKISEKNRIKLKGKGNPNFGKIWVYNEKLDKKIMITKD